MRSKIYSLYLGLMNTDVTVAIILLKITVKKNIIEAWR